MSSTLSAGLISILEKNTLKYRALVDNLCSEYYSNISTISFKTPLIVNKLVKLTGDVYLQGQVIVLALTAVMEDQENFSQGQKEQVKYLCDIIQSSKDRYDIVKREVYFHQGILSLMEEREARLRRLR